MNAPLLLLLAEVALAGTPVDPFEEPDESELFRLDEELVTVASRYAQTVEKAPGIVTLVTADEIRERGYRDLSDLLRDLPGLYVWKSPEGRELVAFRGVVAPDNNKILLMVDGVPWYDGVYTHAFVDQYLPLAHVKQVEVIKGPGSAIYGTNAFAGVINVVTWSPADLSGARVRWTAGSFGWNDVTGTFGGSRRVGTLDTAIIGYARVFSQDGDGLDVAPDLDRSVLAEDPRRALNVGARLEVEGLRVQVHHVDYRHTYLTRQSADTVFEALATDLDTNGILYHDTFFDLRYLFQVGEALEITPHLWSQRHDNPGSYYYIAGIDTEDPDGDGIFDSELDAVLVETEKDTRRWGTGVDLQARPGIDHHTVGGLGIEHTAVLALADYQYDNDNPDGKFTGFGIENASVPPHPLLCNAYGFVQHSWVAAPGVELVGGARADRRYGCSEGYEPADEAVRINVSPRAAVLLVPSDRVTVKLLYGQAFRYPTVREVLVASPLTSDGSYVFTNGNRGLVPESIQTAEGEVSATVADDLHVRGDVSYSLVTNEINKLATELGSEYDNLGRGLGILGLEGEVRAELGIADARLAYAYTRAQYAVGGDAPYGGRVQYEFPPHMLKANLRVSATNHLVGTATIEAYSDRPRRDWSPDARVGDGDAFGLLHLGVRMIELGPQGRVEIGASARNLLDQAWETGIYRDDVNAVDDGAAKYPLGIEGTGRAVYVSLEARL